MYTYNWYQWMAFFYIYCFFGWIFESVYVSLKKHRLVNRGFLRIPMLPLYGFGAVMMLWGSLPVRNNLFLVYIFGVAAATCLEYLTGSIMESLFKVRYWDYSKQKFQLHGYICLTSSIAWGFLTILMTELIHEPIARTVLRLNQNLLLIMVFFTTLVFLADVFESTKTALSLGKSLEAITKLRADLEELEARLSMLKEEAAEHLYLAREETAERLNTVRNETKVKIASLKQETTEKMAAAKLRRDKALTRLLRSNPDAVSSRFAAALKELREDLEK